MRYRKIAKLNASASRSASRLSLRRLSGAEEHRNLWHGQLGIHAPAACIADVDKLKREGHACSGAFRQISQT
jgi:hypothetical protein